MRKLIKRLGSRNFLSYFKGNAKRTPIFIISFNRKWQLERAIRSYEQLGNVGLVIHDNGSDDPEVVTYLKKLESEGVTVNWSKKIHQVADLNNVNESIEKYFKGRPRVNYIVTDPDIELLPDAKDTLEIYNFFLKHFPEIESVGPMLKIDDIPTDYPLHTNVLNRHIKQFWSRKPEILVHRYEPIAYLPCTIDTTFSMHRASSRFKRMTKGIRLYGKYAARHLDWYNPHIVNEAYSRSSSDDIAHWGNTSFHQEFKDDTLLYNSYFDVVPQGEHLKVIERNIRAPK